jgi:biotin carboxylase
MKKLLMLGGSLYQTYAIREAKRLGYYVVSCDYLPNNPGHKYADEYYNVSTTDKEAVLQLAKTLKVDGVVAYASDPAAPTAAYVCEALGLPTSPFKSVEILSNKDLFRRFLQDNGFACPKAMGFSSYEEAAEHIDEFRMPVMVKPVDSSGSKGINKMTDKSQLKAFVEDALSYSRRKRFLIEEFIVKKGHQISGDAFSVDGRLVFHCLGNEFYDPACDKDFAPLGECWPFQMDHKYIEDLEQQLQRLMTLLNMKSNAYNVEAIVGEDDRVYLLELGARSGGSLIPQVTKYATGIDMVTWVVQAAAGDEIDLSMLKGRKEMPVGGYWSNYMVHSNVTGKFLSIEFDKQFEENHLVEFVTDLKVGDEVHRFRDAQDCIGEFILKYDSMDEMFEVIKNIESKITVTVS